MFDDQLLPPPDASATPADLGPPRCRWCADAVPATGLRDSSAVSAFAATGLCQTCQDEAILARSSTDPAVRYAVRRGVVVSVRRDGPEPCEIAVLPFVFTVPEPRLAWDLRLLVRAGPGLAREPLSVGLFPMMRAWSEHRVHLSEVESFEDPALVDLMIEAELVVALGLRTLCAVSHHCGPLPLASCVSLTDLFPWHGAYGLGPLQCLDHLRLSAAGSRDVLLPWPPTALGECSLIAAFLELTAWCPPYDGRTAFEVLLELLRGRFHEPRPDTGTDSGAGDAGRKRE